MTAANNVALSAKIYLYQLWHDKREKSAAIRERVNGGFYSCAFCSLSSCAFPYMLIMNLFLFYYLKLAIIQIYLWRQTHGTEHSEIKILALR